MSKDITYPAVVDEFETLELVCAGKSIGRFGDGEFNLARGGNCVSQVGNHEIREELMQVLHGGDKNCIVGIPRLDPRSPKDVNWSKLSRIYAPLLHHKRKYYSSFITRPDSAPWISTKEYFDKVESLWAGKDITMVYGSERSLSKDFHAMKSAESIHHIPGRYRDAYGQIDQLEQEIAHHGTKTVLLMIGPTATCLAPRLARRGHHAIDLGHIGMWWRCYDNPKVQKYLRLVQ